MMGEDGVGLMHLLSSSMSASDPSATAGAFGAANNGSTLKVTVGSRGVWSGTMEFDEDVVLESGCINYTIPDPAGEDGGVESIEIYTGMSATRQVSVARHYCETTTWTDGGRTGSWADPLHVDIPVGPAVRFVSIHIHGSVDSSI